jgi:excinuclease ABC subunit A
VIEKVKREGFVRVRVDGQILELAQPEPIRLKKTGRHTIEAVVDRLVVREGIRTRLADSVETALKWGGNKIVVLRQSPGSAPDEWLPSRYSTDYGNADTNFSLGELTPKHFSFNSHFGACPTCHGLGHAARLRSGVDDLGHHQVDRGGGDRPVATRDEADAGLLQELARRAREALRVDELLPYADLPDAFKTALIHGTGETPIQMSFGANGKAEKAAKPFEGLIPQMQRLYEETESQFTRTGSARYDAGALPDLQGCAAQAGDPCGHDQRRDRSPAQYSPVLRAHD